MKKLGILAAMAVMITGFLTLGAGTAHAGWTLLSTCTSGNYTYKVKKKNTTLYGVRKCPGGSNCDWAGYYPTEEQARLMTPCL